MNQIYREVNPTLRAQFQSIFAHIELSKSNYSACLDCVERAVELIPKIHYSNNDVYISILLCSLAMYEVFDKNKVPIENQRLRTKNSISVNEELSPSRGSKMSPAEPKKSNVPLKAEYVVKATRTPDGTMRFDYRPANPVKSSATSPNTPSGTEMLHSRIKRISQDIIVKLGPFQGHSLTEPFCLLLKALIKMCDPTAVTSATTIDGPLALRAWVQYRCKVDSGDMKLIIALLAIKCWAASHESLEYTTDLNVGMNMLAEMGLDGLAIF